MKDKIKSYGFWTALAGALVVLVEALGKCFGFSVDNEVVSGVVMAVAGVLVVLGVVAMPKGGTEDKESTKTDKADEETTTDKK